MDAARLIMNPALVRTGCRFRPTAVRVLLAILGLILVHPVLAAQCSAQSGGHTTALVELYTSEGCDSCPPADRWLSGLGARGYVPGRVVPLSLHVDYWDYIGWKDPYARQQFSSRQRKMTELQRRAFVYTPQVMLQGMEFRGWSSSAFDEAVARINARMAKARLELRIDRLGKDRVEMAVGAELLDPAERTDAALYLAAYENKLASQVTAGENRGRTLEHDYVVLEWLGPLDFARGVRLEERRVLPLLPKAVPLNSGVAAFVQNRRNGEVLQALMLPACPAI
jgi:hypothetical protein